VEAEDVRWLKTTAREVDASQRHSAYSRSRETACVFPCAVPRMVETAAIVPTGSLAKPSILLALPRALSNR